MIQSSTTTGIKQGNRDSKGRFIRGFSGNPGGNPNARKNALGEIAQAIEDFQKEHGVPYWKAATILAMKLAQNGNVTLLCKIMDKFVPSKVDLQMPEDAPETLPFVIEAYDPIARN